jgi:hypothetical protein
MRRVDERLLSALPREEVPRLGRLLEAAFKAWKKIRDGNRSPLRRAGRFGDIRCRN